MSKNRTTYPDDPTASSPSMDVKEIALTNVTFLIVPRFNMATLMTVIEPMRIANYLSPRPIYSWEIVSFDGDEIVASNGFSLPAHAPTNRNRRGEVIFVMGSWGAESYRNTTLFSWIRRQAREGARICAVELGTYLVARSGILSGRSVTTHWSYGPGFQEQFPDITFVEQIYTGDDGMMTCGGGMAGVDMMLRLIGEAHGESLIGEIADQLMHHPVRPATAPQRRTMGRSTDTMVPMVREAIALIERNITEPLSVPDIADALAVSQRQMERQFKQTIGCTVVQFGLLLRLQHARVLLISTTLSVRDIATASGFNTLSHFAFSFGKCFGRRPSEYRQAWPEKDSAPSWPGTLSKFLLALQNRGTAKPIQVLRKS
ncbi:GlxA family transcriptional regulator [Cypionkella sp.]|uniref:GlxA family transcriptional regulator n=1 Tax=Cypionkella sp. TaxID=2811411 RepID=UPI00271BB673|nr:GlxA family transcriptional regulator [Cypionkella sp.]MDO8983689.1 GlxA family transcriptional regulator [Cypionkella sp.]MDP2050076.1 GlxA family transcriptional regulator [Cypionkella sp.]